MRERFAHRQEQVKAALLPAVEEGQAFESGERRVTGREQFRELPLMVLANFGGARGNSDERSSVRGQHQRRRIQRREAFFAFLDEADAFVAARADGRLKLGVE